MERQKRYGYLTFSVPKNLLGILLPPVSFVVEDENNIEWRAVSKLPDFINLVKLCTGVDGTNSTTKYAEFSKNEYRVSFISKPKVRLKYVEEEHRVYMLDHSGSIIMGYMTFETEEMKLERHIMEAFLELNGTHADVGNKAEFIAEVKSSKWKTKLGDIMTAKQFDNEHLINTIRYIITYPRIVMSLNMTPKQMLGLIDLTEEEANEIAKEWVKKYPTLISLIAEAKLRGIYEVAN